MTASARGEEAGSLSPRRSRNRQSLPSPGSPRKASAASPKSKEAAGEALSLISATSTKSSRGSQGDASPRRRTQKAPGSPRMTATMTGAEESGDENTDENEEARDSFQMPESGDEHEEGSSEYNFGVDRPLGRRASNIKERLAGLNSASKTSSKRISLQNKDLGKQLSMLTAGNDSGKRQGPPGRHSLYSMGNRLSTSPVSRHSNPSINVSIKESRPAESKVQTRSAMNPFARRDGSGGKFSKDLVTLDEDSEDQKGTRGIRKRSSNDTRPPKPWSTKAQFVRFDPTGPNPGARNEAAFTGRYVDELAIERSQREFRHKLAAKTAKDNAILHHRDSMLQHSASVVPDLSLLQSPRNRKELISTPRKLRHRQRVEDSSTRPDRSLASSPRPMTSPTKPQWSTVHTLRRLALFESCSEHFLGVLAASAEQIQLKLGEVKDIGNARNVNMQATPAMAVVVESGMCRIEVGHTIVSECGPGCSFGLANVLNGFANNSGRIASRQALVGPLADFLVRAGHDSCRCIVFPCTAFRHALSECPEDGAYLRELLRMVNQPIDVTQQLAAYLNCCDSAKPAITESSTREVYAKGEKVVIEGGRTPDALIFVRSGVATLEIKGVEVRSIHKGDVVGEEMLFGVCRKWAFTVRCATVCDIQILHRHLFMTSIFKMQEGNCEDKRESQRLLMLVDGTWKEDRVHLSWPLFRGYDQDFLGKLAQVIETRVLLSGFKLWENIPSWHEVALYFLLCGTCEETQTTERHVRKDVGQTQRAMQQADAKCVKRALVPGACVGVREFLGLPPAGHVVIKAQSQCLAAVLHRSVFLHVLDGHPEKGFQSSEVKRLLEEDLDKKQDKGAVNAESILSSVPILNGRDQRFIERLRQDVVVRRFCITGQYLCRSHIPVDTAFVLIRGEARLCIAGLEIKQYSSGQAINMIALSTYAFLPCFTVTCDRTSEFWAIVGNDFMTCLKAFPVERHKLEDLLHIPDSMPDLFTHGNAVLMNHEHLDTLLAGHDHKSSSPISPISPLAQRRSSVLQISIPSLQPSVCPSRRGSTPIGRGSTPIGSAVPVPPNPFGTPDPSSPNALELNMALAEVAIFSECSHAFLHWLHDNLQAAVWFPHETVIKEGQEDTSLYIMRSGTVVVENSGAQETLTSGACFGEYRLLGVSQVVKATTIAIEISVLQVLHRNVFQHGLELFPDEKEHFDRVTLEKLESTTTFDLASSPFFFGCNRDFRMQAERLMKVRLVHEGAIIVEEGEEGRSLRILKSGSALVEEDGTSTEPLKRVSAGVVMNADLVLGVSRCAVSNIRAEKLCAVAEIESLEFLDLLQRFPQEIVPLLTHTVGQLWPPEAEAVPLFRGVNSYFFQQLMDSSEWHMFLPGHCVVRQGGAGQMLFLLCYGVAVSKVDGVIVRGPLLRGECIGKANFFGLVGKYSFSVYTQTVCHFRTILSHHLTRLLQDHAAEHERFESMKQQVLAELVEHEQMVINEVTREKLRRRTEVAFRGHVAREREARGLQANSSTASLESLKMLDADGGSPKAAVKKSKAQRASPEKTSPAVVAQEEFAKPEDDAAFPPRTDDAEEDKWSKVKNKIKVGGAKTLASSKRDPPVISSLSELANGLKPKLNALVEKIKQHREHDDEDQVDQIWSERAEGERQSLFPKEKKFGFQMDGARRESLASQTMAAPDAGDKNSPKGRSTIKRSTVSSKKQGKRRKRGPASLRPGQAGSRSTSPAAARLSLKAGTRKEDDGGESWNGQDDASDESSDDGGKKKYGFGGGTDMSSTSNLLSTFKVRVTDFDMRRESVGEESVATTEAFDTFEHEQIFHTRLEEIIDTQPSSKLQQIDAAINEHADKKQQAILKGRVLRLLHNGLPLDGTPRGANQLSQEDLHELIFHLPQLQPPISIGNTEAAVSIREPRQKHRDAMLCGGVPPMRTLPPAHEKAMRRKYMQLTGQQLGVLPCG